MNSMETPGQPETRLTKRQLRELRRQEKHQERQTAGRGKIVRRLLIWSTTVIGLGLIVWGLVFFAQGDRQSNGTNGTVDPLTAADHVRGARTAPVVLIEYSDFQCPACATYEPLLQQLSAEFPDQLALVYRHFPLTSIHAQAEPAAQAAEAAGLQNKFWEFHDLLFDRQKDWSTLPNTESIFEDYAEELELDLEQFKRDRDSDAVKNLVRDDLASGNRINLRGTPSFFLNGESIENPRSVEDFRALITAELPATQPTE